MAQGRRARRRRPVVPDRLDLRDRPYDPSIATVPSSTYDARKLLPKRDALPVLDQGDTNACTGFALSNVVNWLLRVHGGRRGARVSPFMIYSMARRYDEFPGSSDTGSSLRGAMKGWYKQGVCADSLWKGLGMPKASNNPAKDWWQDAAQRPLGAYYRVDPRSVSDMHVALTEAGVLYASVACHSRWEEGSHLSPAKRRGWIIPYEKAGPDDGGHAIAIVGYDSRGFLIMNSWGTSWGDGGYAWLGYEDWLDNAMDCWVAQIGVVTEQHKEIAAAITLRQDARKQVVLAGDARLRNREISPFIVDMENNGELSSSGDFRTNASDLEALVTTHMDEARSRWKLGNRPMDIAIYAHGGLTGEDTAANTAAQWIPALYDAKIFPIFFMWETGLFATLKNRLSDLVHHEPRPTGGVGDWFKKFWDRRLEQALAGPGTLIWGEMKQNAWAISGKPKSGARVLYDLSQQVPGFGSTRVRLHLIGHSAGSIVHSYLAEALGQAGWKFASVHFMAPAVTVKTFKETLLPRIESGDVGTYHQYHLTDDAEMKDPTCRPILGYGRSLLYLVSQSFEHGKETPILGMAKYLKKAGLQGTSAVVHVAPGSDTASTTHGGFDDDALTRETVIRTIRGLRASGSRRTGRTRKRRSGPSRRSR